jgi:hypothetical protein
LKVYFLKVYFASPTGFRLPLRCCEGSRNKRSTPPRQPRAAAEGGALYPPLPNAAADDDGMTNNNRAPTDAHRAARSDATSAINATRANHRIGVFHGHGHGSNEKTQRQSNLNERFHREIPVLRLTRRLNATSPYLQILTPLTV